MHEVLRAPGALIPLLRRGLDLLYAAGGAFAACCLFGIFATMMAQVGLRSAGRQLPGADDVTAYLCVGATFFALAATFKRGELIRVGMGLDRLRPGTRRWAEFAVLLLAAVVVGYICRWTAEDAWFSWEIEELAQGVVPIPLWWPKLAMPLGSGLLLIAVLDEAVRVLLGARPGYVVAAERRAAAGDFSTEV